MLPDNVTLSNTSGIDLTAKTRRRAKRGEPVKNPVQSTYNWKNSLIEGVTAYTGIDQDHSAILYLDSGRQLSKPKLIFSGKLRTSLPQEYRPVFTDLMMDIADGELGRLQRLVDTSGTHQIDKKDQIQEFFHEILENRIITPDQHNAIKQAWIGFSLTQQTVKDTTRSKRAKTEKRMKRRTKRKTAKPHPEDQDEISEMEIGELSDGEADIGSEGNEDRDKENGNEGGYDKGQNEDHAIIQEPWLSPKLAEEIKALLANTDAMTTPQHVEGVIPMGERPANKPATGPLQNSKPPRGRPPGVPLQSEALLYK